MPDPYFSTFSANTPDGGYNRELTAEATNRGLIVDNHVLIPWRWFDEVRLVVLPSLHEHQKQLP